ncbi:hypothetical protein DFH06DRAFT_601847 [Mycena polygramma]|nr:hypothetical protein DFH06DRAFT_601847 [Mycena polygramma]
MSTPSLPACLPVQEMWDHIIDDLQQSNTDLRSCSLVCWSFVARVQSHIFRCISIDKKHPKVAENQAEILASKLASILAESSHIIPYIRILYLGDCRGAVVTHLHRIPWSHLEELNLRCYKKSDRIPDANLNHIHGLVGLPSIRQVSIGGEGWGGGQIFKIVTHCTPHLERLIFWHCSSQLGPFHTSDSTVRVTQPKIRQLIFMDSDALSGVFTDRSLPLDLSTLTHVRSSGSMAKSFRSFLLRHCPTVESLRFGGEDSGIELINLELFPLLNHLACDDIGFQFNQMLQSLPPNSAVNTIRVNLFGRRLTMAVIEDFEATIIALRMRRVELVVNAHSPYFMGSHLPTLARMIRRDFEQLEERGLLFVYFI